ncbi:hypothetical protein A0H81_08689 [Grifola frondosa]|uniref:PAS domain-containing protein n=1 Tax=Grifola frondosa TaxID=5627 RepID=A0A1C7M8C1_GRIFR|nr:hypothetical protein A0H81_08689 [Grifola frondosa]
MYCFEPHELIGTPSLNLVHPDEFVEVKALHYTTIKQDQAAVLAYLRMRHKDPYKGYILCAISRTVCQNVLVGSVSFATPGPKAMHNASTAQEVKIITPTAKDFEFRRWNDPNPMPPCPIPTLPESPSSASSSSSADSPLDSPPLRFAPLPEQSVRTALILDRFSVNCGILYCSNDSLLSTTKVMGRSFFDFVMPKDESLVRSWIDVIKGWGVNERGQPSDGGFGFGKFTGRDSRFVIIFFDMKFKAYWSSVDSVRNPDPVPSRHRTQTNPRDNRDRPHHREAASARQRPRARTGPRGDALVVDAIFSAHSDGLMVILRKSTS